MSNVKNEQCSQCRFYHIAGKPDYHTGVCRRSAPVPQMLFTEDVFVAPKWPLVDAEWWCGEWQPASQTEVDSRTRNAASTGTAGAATTTGIQSSAEKMSELRDTSGG